MGGSNTTIEAPRIGSLQVNSSAYGLVIPIVRGTARVKGNVLWFGDFRAIKHKQSSGGKGGGGVTNVTYTYEAAIMLALCNGPILGVGTVWKNKEKTSIAHINIETGNQIKDILNPPAEVTLMNGETSQAVWGYLSTKHPDQAIGYTGLAYICSTRMQLSADAGIQQLSFEILSTTATGQLDDNPKDIIIDFLSNPIYGAGFPTDKIDDLTDYGNWCAAAGLFLSPAFQEQKEAREWLAEIAQCTNSQFVWSAGKLKLVPYADAAVTGNGITYTPNLTPVYDLDDDAFQASGDDDPVTCSRITTADAYNHIQIEFLNRDRDYNVEIAEAKDQADIEAKGLRTKDPLKLPMICKTTIARNVAQMILQRDLYIRNIYEFRLTWKHCLLEPMDLVTITDLTLGLDKAPARIIEIEEDDEGMLTVRAEEYPFGVNSSAVYPVQDTAGYLPDYQVLPGDANAPAIFEPTFRLTENNLEIWVGTSGGETWGGCEVWVSRDNATYARAGVINESARHGTLVNQLPSGSAVDTANTMRVQLADFYNNQMLSASQTEADELRTLMWVDGELIAYRDAVLVSAGVYDLTYLIRGAHNTPITAHAAGSKFARIEDDFFRYSFLPSDIGKIIYIKLVSFNIYNVATQNISDITPYTYTITGYARQRLPVDITAPPAPAVTTAANNTYPYTGHLILSWTAVPGISKYVVRYKKSTDSQWKESPVASATTWKSPELPSGSAYDVAIASEDEQGYLSSWTAGAQTTIPYDATAPTTPGVITITPGIGFLAIQWPHNADVDIAGYELQIAPDSSGAPGIWATVYTGPGNTHTYKGTTGSVYWARVRAFDHYPGSPKYSAYNGQTSAMVDFVKALDSANVPTGYNLQINSDFDAGTLDGWQVSQWGSLPTVVTATTPRSGKYAARNTANTTASIQGVRMIPCNPDRAYILEAYAATVSGATGTFYLRVYFYTAAGAATTPAYLSAAEAVTPGVTPTFYSKVFGAGQTDVLPSGAVYMRPVVILNYNNGDRIMETQGVRIREMIESLYVKNASMTDADILNVSASKIVSGSVTSQTITLALTEGAGDVAIKAGKTDFGDNTAGIILGMDDSDGNLPKLEIGDATDYLKYRPGTGLQVAGSITITGGSGYGNLTDRPTSLGDINVSESNVLGSVQPGATNTLRYTQATDPIPLHPTFSRASTAYLANGTKIDSGKPRIEPGKFGGAIMAEEGTTNLLLPGQYNASDTTLFSVDTDCVLSLETTSPISGASSIKCVTPAVAVKRLYFSINNKPAVTAGLAYSGQMLVKGSGTVTFVMGAYNSSNVGVGNSASIDVTLTATPQLIKIENFIIPTGGVNLQIIIGSKNAEVCTIIADCYQLEAKAYATSFIDGTRVVESLLIDKTGLVSDTAGTIEVLAKTEVDRNNYQMPFNAWQRFYVSWNGSGVQGRLTLSWVDTGGVQRAVGVDTGLPHADWHHYALAWTAEKMMLYLDGVLKIDTLRDYGATTFKPFPTSYIDFGSTSYMPNYPFDGVFDSVRLSNIARTDAEILASATSGLPMERDAYTTALFDFNTGIEWLNNGTLKTYNGVAWEDAATWGAPTGTYVGATLADTVSTVATNFNTRNDRNSAAVVAPVIADATGTIDHTVNTDGSVDVSFEWSWAGTEADIDGFVVYVHDNGTTTPTSQKVLAATADASVQVFYLTPQRRAFILYGVAANHWYTFGVQAYRIVDQDIDATGTKKSAIVQPLSTATETTYGAYQPASVVAFAGDITGTIAGTAASTVVTNATNGATAYTGTSAYRNSSAPTNNGEFGAISSTQTADGNVVVTVPYTYTQGTIKADQLLIFVREGGGTVVASDPSWLTNAVSGSLKFTLKPSTTYTFGIQAVRRTEAGLTGTAILTSGSIATSAANFTGNLNGTAASTVVSNAASGANAWSKFSGAGNTLPSGNVEFNFAASGSKGGNATNTDNVGTQSAATVQGATINFNSRNDRNATAVVAPVVADAVGTIDHTVNTDGSVDVSFEWTWGGVEADIDGFIVYVHDNGTTTPTTQKVLTATADASVQVFYLTPQRRAFILYGVAANHWYTFGVQAYRIVDQDIDATGTKKSAIVQPLSTATETTYGAYRPASSVAFAGDITGTIAGTAASTVVSNANSAYTLVSDIASDSKLTPVEKQDIRREWDAIYSEKSSLDAQATALGITTEKTTYDNSIQALGTYLNGGTAYTLGATPPSWITDANLSATTTIVGATFRSTFKTYYDAKIALINKMAAVAATKADWTGVSGTGKPADYATKNTASSGTTPHANPQAGDTWFNSSTTDGTYYALTSYSYNGSAWIPSSPRGTYITSTGVYTGLVVADQIQTGGLRGINVNAASHTTKGSYLTQACADGATTLYVHNTTDFPTSGSGWILDATNDRDAISWTGKTVNTLTGVTGALAHGVGVTAIPRAKNMVIDDGSNEMRFYGDRGDGVVEELANIGLASSSGDQAIGAFGTQDCTKAGITTISKDSYGISATSVDYIAVKGWSNNFYGAEFYGAIGPVRLVPSSSSAAPTHYAYYGTLWVTSTGVLYINNSPEGVMGGFGNYWAKVGAQ